MHKKWFFVFLINLVGWKYKIFYDNNVFCYICFRFTWRHITGSQLSERLNILKACLLLVAAFLVCFSEIEFLYFKKS